MARHTVPPRRRKTIPGLKICRTCSTIYTRSQAVCPRCHNMPGTWTRTTQPPTTNHQQPATIWIAPKPRLDETAFPEWLRDFDKATQMSLDRLSQIAKTATGVARETARALLAYRYREEITGINLAAVESEVHQWFASHPISAYDDSRRMDQTR